ncbi:MAG TPA: hypothetical protein VNR59_03010 [Gaiellaceae bacterium]|nr:hypothetical protein [Gaiellaceae bacterium]HWJ45421.1 hypothetical protein [Gaiellaceae bacterium]
MRTMLKLAVLAVASTAALAFAGNALAVQKLSVTQSATSMTIKVTQAQTDPQPAKIQIFVPTGYTLNTSAAPGTVIGTTSGSVFARDANIPLPLSGDVVVAPPNTNAAPCFTGTHLAVWLLRLQVAGQSIQLPIAVDPTAGTNAAFGSFQLVTCLAPSDVPQGTPGRSPNGAQLLEAVFTVNNVFAVPAQEATWKTLTTPYTPAIGVPNQAGTVETRALVGTGTLSLSTRVTNKKKRVLRITGKLQQSGAGVVGAQVRLLLNGKASKFTARTSSTGNYSIVLRKTGRKSTTTFQARVTVAERDVTSTACASPTLPVVACVSATAGGFTALSPRKKIRL